MAGSPWQDIPERYGSYTTCVNRFQFQSLEQSGALGEDYGGNINMLGSVDEGTVLLADSAMTAII